MTIIFNFPCIDYLIMNKFHFISNNLKNIKISLINITHHKKAPN